LQEVRFCVAGISEVTPREHTPDLEIKQHELWRLDGSSNAMRVRCVSLAFLVLKRYPAPLLDQRRAPSALQAVQDICCQSGINCELRSLADEVRAHRHLSMLAAGEHVMLTWFDTELQAQVGRGLT